MELFPKLLVIRSLREWARLGIKKRGVLFWVMFSGLFFMASVFSVLVACVLSVVITMLLRGEAVELINIVRLSVADALRGGVFVTGAVIIVILVNRFMSKGVSEFLEIQEAVLPYKKKGADLFSLL
ncbi:hypothetical protein DM872_07685 [Pseudomonas taiwanensis]|nr:hypothetical protein [Pseudomonas taiwanensis]